MYAVRKDKPPKRENNVYKDLMKGPISIPVLHDRGWRDGAREADLKGRTHSLGNWKLNFQVVGLRDFFLFLLLFCIFYSKKVLKNILF